MEKNESRSKKDLLDMRWNSLFFYRRPIYLWVSKLNFYSQHILRGVQKKMPLNTFNIELNPHNDLEPIRPTEKICAKFLGK